MQGSNITILIAFVAGLLSFLTPCVLPLVPGYISLMSGVTVEHLKGDGESSRASAWRAVVANSLAFNAGVSLIFMLLGATAGWIGNVLFSTPWVRYVGGGIIFLFGLQMMGVLKIGALYKDTRKFSDDKPRGPFGSALLGVAFAAGWTPCIGPILGGIIGLAATSGGWKSGLILSAFYSAGLALPFLGVGLAMNWFLGFYSRFRRHLHKVEVASGVLLMVIGLMVGFNILTRLSSFASRYIPNAENLVKQDAPVAPAGDAAAAPRANTQNASNAAAAEPAPDIELKTTDGKPLKLSELRGQVVLLNFWATWCVPCRSEIPSLNEMQRDLSGRGFKVLGVSTSDSAELVREYQKDVKQDYTVALGDDGVANKYAVGVLPTTFVIDREGRIRHKEIGEKTRAYFESLIKPLLDEQASTAALGSK
ncbi:MAG TPA: cytochrome c biogenesis protein/redoxin [Pyrinomonadaceae bacterium]|jgi:cytochrome c-type biogenesis protein|nr:cytochrome c biogenesis protein/redoxin [Pyrinomonadaceae bacterium]